ncbi:hypothetical protein [Streptomyces aureus]|nr:hypothetical protein [Streptomyces aureus]
MTGFILPLAAALVIVAFSTVVLVRRDRRTMGCRGRLPHEHE